MRIAWVRGVFVSGCLAVGLLSLLPAAWAAAIVVTSTTDGGAGSLREAFNTANGNGQDDEIVLSAGATYDLTICGGAVEEDANADGDLDHSAAQALTITGNGATIRNTCPDERVIEQLGTGPLALKDVTITGGDALTDGGGIQAPSSDVTLTNSSLTGNTAGDHGGGIYAPAGDLTITGSTISMNNAVVGAGGGVYGSMGPITIMNSTFAGNTAGDDGGGIRSSGATLTTITGSTFAGNKAAAEGGVLRTSSGDVVVTNSTLSGNTSATDGGAIIDSSGSISLNNATLVGNDAADEGDALQLGLTGTAQFANTILSGPGDECGGLGTFTSNGYNIGSDAGCNLTGSGDKPGTDAVLGPLSDNGGPTQTHALLKGSPAIDAGSPAPAGSGSAACEATDQRGAPRNCDIGAYERVLCRTTVVNRVGTAGPDSLTGTGGKDGFLAFGGRDRLAGKGGKDALCAGPGKDTLRGGAGNDRLLGQGGVDICIGSGGRDKAIKCEQERGVP